LVFSPSLNVDGRKPHSTRGQLFDRKLDGRFVVKRSTTPFCDAARALLAEGVRPEAKLVMQHAGSLADALRSTVGAAAKLTVVDDRSGKPIFARWSPYDGRSLSLDASPMRETDLAAVRVLTRSYGRQEPRRGAARLGRAWQGTVWSTEGRLSRAAFLVLKQGARGRFRWFIR
jgi:hypothetical protein